MHIAASSLESIIYATYTGLSPYIHIFISIISHLSILSK